MVIIALISFAVGATAGNSNTKSATETPVAAASSSPSPSVSSEPVKPINLSGTGQMATEKFNLKSGLATAKLTATGDGHFGVWLLNSGGDKVELLANDSGQPFNGSKAFQVPNDGQYLLDVEVDNGAAWTVDITQ
ncbi:MAG: putative lipoprotein [Candidatus Saccharibacteria bacterium]|nr:putative lipoprotein [Candidatus Saccharibacteria bacterium]